MAGKVRFWYYRHKQQLERREQRELGKLKGKPAITRDGMTIGLYANIEQPEDATAVRDVAADGIGLYRTEFLFMNRTETPDEEEHLASYLHVIKVLDGIPVTIRTADLGADKQVDGGRGGSVSTNPALGLRAIRMCLKDLAMFRPQLRAIYPDAVGDSGSVSGVAAGRGDPPGIAGSRTGVR